MADVVFKKKTETSVVDWIVDQILEAITSNELGPGDRLPSEPELSEQMGVGRNSVREAIRILAAYGIIEQRRTGGNYIQKEFNSKMLNPLIYGIITSKTSNQDLIDLRYVLEKGIMELAVKNATEADLIRVQQQMQKQLDYVAHHTPDAETMLELDLEFHETICSCTHSELITQLFITINKIMRPSRLKVHTELIAQGKNQYTIDAHKKMVDTLSNRDMEGAMDAVLFSQTEWTKSVSEAQ